MPDHPTRAEIAACCGQRCLRGTESSGPCMAATYGAGILRRLRKAKFVVVTREDWTIITRAVTKAEEDFDRVITAINSILDGGKPHDA